ncbi:MAG: DUF460 domain-containing protein [Candidatus Nezhaarchaeota archaeon]|nr:DUF460 domain-containing protein [Candidatus Nezhaarchaeota archaeon]
MSNGGSSQRIVMGLDIVESQQYMQEYAVAIVDGSGNTLYRRDGVNWEVVLQLVKKHKVDTLAVDNIYELGSTIDDIKKKLGKHLDKLKVIEVTRTGFHQVKLSELAIRERVVSDKLGHLSPIQAAEVCAHLALKGVGAVILEPSNIRTIITISRGRSLGPGGMSQGRYGRSQRSAIKQVTMMIMDELQKHIKRDEIECYFQKSKYGFERSIMVVCRPPSYVKKWIKPLGEAVRKSGIKLKLLARFPEIEELDSSECKSSDRPLIVGLDPGIVTGLAILDLNGSPLLISSSLALDKVTIVKTLARLGKPVLIASDVKQPPAMIGKIASLMGCDVFTPQRDMTIDEKRSIIRENVENFKDIVKNSHQRDALAAALKAFLSFKNKFAQLESKAKELALAPPQLELAKVMLIKGLTIKESLDKVSSEIGKPGAPFHQGIDPELQKVKRELSRLRDKVKEYEKTIKDLEDSRLSLLKALKERNSRIEELEEALLKTSLKTRSPQEYESILRSRLELSMKIAGDLKRRVEDLDLTVQQLRKLVKRIVRGEVILVKEVRSITKKSVEEAVKYCDLRKRDLLLVRDPSSSNSEGLQCLLSMEPEAIITTITKMPPEVRSKLLESFIPLFDIEEVKVEQAADFLYVESDFRRVVDEYRKRLLLESDRKIEEKVIEIIERYREERVKQLEKQYQAS